MQSKVIRYYIAEKIRELKVGIVHERNRLPKTDNEFDALFEYDGRIQAWMVMRGSIGAADPRTNFLKIPERFLIVTFFGFNDEDDSETLFETSLDTVYTVLSRDKTLGGNVANVVSVSVPDISLISIGEILSHYAEIIVEIEEFDI
jgi:hypothetical protein